MNRDHTSVLLKDFLSFFEGQEVNIFVDATVGAGGHAKALLDSHPEIDLFIANDQDPKALEICKERLASHLSKVRFINGNFSHLFSYLIDEGFSSVDGFLFDLGVSSMQLDTASRGFSFQKDGPLDMRMDPSIELTAENIINNWPEVELGRIFREYGEERHWRAAAREIVKARKKHFFDNSKDFSDFLKSILPSQSSRKIHPATKIFQALRIAVNDEISVIEKALPFCISLLRSGGRLGVISFHSLEDRIVKHTFKEAASKKKNLFDGSDDLIRQEPKVKILTKKPLVASSEEVSENPRSRSAKLRFVEKI